MYWIHTHYQEQKHTFSFTKCTAEDSRTLNQTDTLASSWSNTWHLEPHPNHLHTHKHTKSCSSQLCCKLNKISDSAHKIAVTFVSPLSRVYNIYSTVWGPHPQCDIWKTTTRTLTDKPLVWYREMTTLCLELYPTSSKTWSFPRPNSKQEDLRLEDYARSVPQAFDRHKAFSK